MSLASVGVCVRKILQWKSGSAGSGGGPLSLTGCGNKTINFSHRNHSVKQSVNACLNSILNAFNMVSDVPTFQKYVTFRCFLSNFLLCRISAGKILTHP